MVPLVRYQEPCTLAFPKSFPPSPSPSPSSPAQQATRFLKSDRIFRGRGAVVHGPDGIPPRSSRPRRVPRGGFSSSGRGPPFYSCRPNSKRAVGARTTMECSSACGAGPPSPSSHPPASARRAPAGRWAAHRPAPGN